MKTHFNEYMDLWSGDYPHPINTHYLAPASFRILLIYTVLNIPKNSCERWKTSDDDAVSFGWVDFQIHLIMDL